MPAWIRDGLEKMEREKQRQLERDRQIQDAMNAKNDDERAAVRKDESENEDLTAAAVKSRFVCTLVAPLIRRCVVVIAR